MKTHTARRGGLALAIALGLSIVAPVPQAKADPGLWNYYPSCRHYTANINNSAGSYTYETTTHTTPGASSSTCSDINSIAHPCMNHRIRFYPSGGGSYANSWKFDCDGAFIVASGVANGTVYRNEGAAFGYFHIED